jgi:ATP-dependent Lhr-like helicase
MPLTSFHPAVSAWFSRALGEPSAPQRAAWPAIGAGKHVLVAAPTGSGKTLAAFLWAIDQLVREGLAQGALPDETRVLYVSPLKALSHDVHKNLELPLSGVREELLARGLAPPEIRSWVRTGDTEAKARAQATKRPPQIVVTTPESLYLLLSSEGGRRMLSTVRSVIIDEVHALVRDKRGSHLALSLERLAALVAARGLSLQRIGLSATQKPIERVAEFLIGARGESCEIINTGHRRDLDLALLLPHSPLEAIMSNEVWDDLYEQLVQLISEHKTTLVFVNTRRSAERVARRLSERLGESAVSSHHGSLSREKRLQAEQRLKAGELKALVATASLELGIDIGDVDLVCQLGSPRSIATFLQRVGRSGHRLSAKPKGRLLPLSRDDLVECAALLAAVGRGELDRLCIPVAPLDVLAQQIVAATGVEAWSEDELFALVRRAAPYQGLARADFDAVVRMLADGFSTRRGRRGALLHHDAVGGRLKARRGALLTAVMSGGAIPDTFDYQVLLEPENIPVGTVHEDFAIESMAGDVFQLGNVSYRIRKAEPGLLRVEDARGQTPSIPFWVADAPGRTEELSIAVSRLRAHVDALLGERSLTAVSEALEHEHGLSSQAARELVEYLGAARAALGVLPTRETLVVERFFDETDSMHLVLHAPFGTRINRAFGLALRKRFCRSFNVELQAAANDDGIVLSLGPMHSFVLEEIFRFLRADGVQDVLIQALLPAPMFGVRFRWNASRALAIPRFRGGKKVPPRFQRMAADDLLAVTFPDQVACAENLAGEREIPDHPLVRQTIDDCLHEAMDIDGLRALLGRIERAEVTCVARDLSEPSPLAHELVNARPYAFLDDAPLEERRTQAVRTRRLVDAASARDLSALDPEAIARVVAEARLEPRDADELHDLLLVHAALPESEGREHQSLFAELCGAARAGCLTLGQARLWVAAERSALWRLVAPEAALEPACAQPVGVACGAETREQALREVVRGRLEAVGPVTAVELAAALGLSEDDVEVGLFALEAEGFVLRGHYRPGAQGLEWCERRLLARIHRATLDRLRSEIEPVSPAVLLRFLAQHQHVSSAARLSGIEGLSLAIGQLSGFELAASAWESDVLPLRVSGYAPEQLDLLCFSGRVSWARAGRPVGARDVPLLPRRRPPNVNVDVDVNVDDLREASTSTIASTSTSARGLTRIDGPIRTTPIALYARESMHALRGEPPACPPLSSAAERVHRALSARGASFVSELSRATALEPALVQEALGELIGQGLVTSDGFAGLRSLIALGKARPQADAAGRYALLASERGHAPADSEARLVALAHSLLARWGIVLRKLLERESSGVRWGELLPVLRRMEARGELRGGRFVANFGGEQYALPEVVGQLRKLRKQPPSGELLTISASDPLNLVGIIAPGARIPAQPSTRILLRDGMPVAVLGAGACQCLIEASDAERTLFEAALRGRAGALRAPALSWPAQA